MPKIEIIAFYLPQFYVIAENEELYGKNFTEWENVKRATPLFINHYQPHEPHNIIGYYSLLDRSFIEYQHRLAYKYGVKNFCYYYYNFGDRVLLDKPLKLIIQNKNIKNKFCLCWAHHSWYNNRTMDRNVFIQQNYSIDKIKYIVKDIIKYIDNDRYIFIDNKPMFLIWAPEKIPNTKEYLYEFRNTFIKYFNLDILLAGVEAFGGHDPNELGMDFMVEYAPNWFNECMVCTINNIRIYNYAKTILKMIKKEVPEYIRLRCCFPSWDNTPRRGDRGIVFANSAPELFRHHLIYLYNYTENFLPDNLKYIFINAWNEWGEGCHLEPDKKYGFSYLDVIKNIDSLY